MTGKTIHEQIAEALTEDDLKNLVDSTTVDAVNEGRLTVTQANEQRKAVGLKPIQFTEPQAQFEDDITASDAKAIDHVTTGDIPNVLNQQDDPVRVEFAQRNKDLEAEDELKSGQDLGNGRIALPAYDGQMVSVDKRDEEAFLKRMKELQFDMIERAKAAQTQERPRPQVPADLPIYLVDLFRWENGRNGWYLSPVPAAVEAITNAAPERLQRAAQRMIGSEGTPDAEALELRDQVTEALEKYLDLQDQMDDYAKTDAIWGLAERIAHSACIAAQKHRDALNYTQRLKFRTLTEDQMTQAELRRDGWIEQAQYRAKRAAINLLALSKATGMAFSELVNNKTYNKASWALAKRDAWYHQSQLEKPGAVQQREINDVDATLKLLEAM